MCNLGATWSIDKYRRHLAVRSLNPRLNKGLKVWNMHVLHVSTCFFLAISASLAVKKTCIKIDPVSSLRLTEVL